MRRRGFLKLIGQGLASAAVLAAVPIERVPLAFGARDMAACEYLRREFYAWCKLHPGQYPYYIVVGRSLYEAYEGELTANLRGALFTQVSDPRPNLRFKSAKVTYDPTNTGWRVLSIGVDDVRVAQS